MYFYTYFKYTYYLNKLIKYFFTILLVFSGFISVSQNQNEKWYFGNLADLDFMTSPPTNIVGSAMNAFEGCSGICRWVGQFVVLYKRNNGMEPVELGNG